MTLSKDFKKGKYELYFSAQNSKKKGITEGLEQG